MQDHVAIIEERLSTQIAYTQEKSLAIEKLKKDVERAQHRTALMETARKKAETHCHELNSQIGPLTRAVEFSSAQLEDAVLERRQLRERVGLLEAHLQKGQKPFDQQTGTFTEFVQLRRQVILHQQDNRQLCERLLHLKSRLKSNLDNFTPVKPNIHKPSTAHTATSETSAITQGQITSTGSEDASEQQQKDYFPAPVPLHRREVPRSARSANKSASTVNRPRQRLSHTAPLPRTTDGRRDQSRLHRLTVDEPATSISPRRSLLQQDAKTPRGTEKPLSLSLARIKHNQRITCTLRPGALPYTYC